LNKQEGALEGIENPNGIKNPTGITNLDEALEGIENLNGIKNPIGITNPDEQGVVAGGIKGPDVESAGMHTLNEQNGDVCGLKDLDVEIEGTCCTSNEHESDVDGLNSLDVEIKGKRTLTEQDGDL
jgi:hypothetical protein